ncbi:hypothetical protein ACFZAR_03585 [Streptomyces sp. NPDC008222]|uniref:hypothetical protein n=1 Tax=Streptomyces sp. NPDC008222 TaxID=3364820 RepID=UPI0036E7434E
MPIRALAPLLALCSTLFVGAAACGSGSATRQVAAYITVPSPAPSTQAQRQKLAKSRFALSAGLAAGAIQQWIVKPWKAGAFADGAQGRTATLLKAGLAGTFAYDRLKGARYNAQGDPALARALAPVSASVDALKHLPGKLRRGDTSAVAAFDAVIRKVKAAGKSAGAPVHNQVPSGPQLARG